MRASSHKLAWFLPLSLFVGAMVLAATITVAPFIALSQIDQDIVDTQRALADLRDEIAGQRQNMLEGTPEGDTRVLFLDGSTTGIAAANLQKMMNDLVIERNGTPSRFQVWPPKEDGNFLRLDVSIMLEVDIDGLHHIVHAIETGMPLLFIEDLVVRAPQSKAQADNPYFLGPLEVTLRVSGFFRKIEAS